MTNVCRIAWAWVPVNPVVRSQRMVSIRWVNRTANYSVWWSDRNACEPSVAIRPPRRCKRAAPRGLCWFDSNPMHQDSMVAVVQLARTPDCDSGSHGFDSRPSPHPHNRVCAGPGFCRLPPSRNAPRAGGGVDRPDCFHRVNTIAFIAQGRERRHARPEVRGSTPRERAILCGRGETGRHDSLRSCSAPRAPAGSSPAGRTISPRTPQHKRNPSPLGGEGQG